METPTTPASPAPSTPEPTPDPSTLAPSTPEPTTLAPSTPEPTPDPSTLAPSTPVPAPSTLAPSTPEPIPDPSTIAPSTPDPCTLARSTPEPTADPSALAPSTPEPTPDPSTLAPSTPEPILDPSTFAPSTPEPTFDPSTFAPSTPEPTLAPSTPSTPATSTPPSTPAPSTAPSTPASSTAPSTPASSTAPSTPAPSTAPSTPAPSTAPSTPAPSTAPSTPAPSAPSTPAPCTPSLFTLALSFSPSTPYTFAPATPTEPSTPLSAPSTPSFSAPSTPAPSTPSDPSSEPSTPSTPSILSEPSTPAPSTAPSTPASSTPSTPSTPSAPSTPVPSTPVYRSPSINVLICGDVRGQFQTLVKTVTKVHGLKGPFEALYCVGEFFSEDDTEWELLKSESIRTPMPCYVLGPCDPALKCYYPDIIGGDGMELAPNVIYLGKRGILTTGGLKIAYLSGTESADESEFTFTARDVFELQRSYQRVPLRGIDFLLTSQWPKYVTRDLPASACIDPLKSESDLISCLAVTMKPCYHFSGLEGIFYERLPYRNPKSFPEKLSHTSRFVGLGKVANSRGMRFLYGVSHIPLRIVSEAVLRKQKQDEVSTECPYRFSVRPASSPQRTPSSEPSTSAGAAAVASSSSSSSSSSDSDEGSKPKKCKLSDAKAKRPIRAGMKTPLQCWFCLSFPVEKHLLVTVGHHCYLSLAKGWIIPDHLLIISNIHHKCTATLPDCVLNEVLQFKEAVRRYFHAIDKHVVFFERNYRTPHMQVQVVPVPKSTEVDLVKVFLDAAADRKVIMEEIPPESITKQVVGPKKPYFYLEIDCVDEQPKKFLHIIEEEFPFLFPREVLSSKAVLNVPNRVNWKDCTVSPDEEKETCGKFREGFIRYQPRL